jgi:hypothetical protein
MDMRDLTSMLIGGRNSEVLGLLPAEKKPWDATETVRQHDANAA